MNIQSRIESENEVPAPRDAGSFALARGRWRREGRKLFAFAVVPLLIVLIGGYMWLTSGRFESTDNAYVRQNVISVSPEVGGRIVQVNVRENQRVRAGDVLFRIDDAQYRIAVANAEASLANARIKVAQLHSELGARVADAGEKNADVALARETLSRQQALLKRGFTTRASYDQAVRALNASQQQRASAAADVSAARDALTGSGPGTHPLILAAQAALDQARLNLARTLVRAPQAGIISQADRVQIGQQAVADLPAVTLVANGDSWIEANFKETQLRKMHVGQKATVKIDAFGGREYEAIITSIGAGTGSEFSIIPAQNATGNWVKVVQRVPVRLHLRRAPDRQLVAGLSTDVTVDIRS